MVLRWLLKCQLRGLLLSLLPFNCDTHFNKYTLSKICHLHYMQGSQPFSKSLPKISEPLSHILHIRNNNCTYGLPFNLRQQQFSPNSPICHYNIRISYSLIPIVTLDFSEEIY